MREMLGKESSVSAPVIPESALFTASEETVA